MRQYALLYKIIVFGSFHKVKASHQGIKGDKYEQKWIDIYFSKHFSPLLSFT